MFSFNGNHFATYRDGVEADTTSEIYTALVQYVDIFKKLIKPASYTNTFRERPLSCFLMYLQSTTDPQIASHPVTASQGSNNRAVCQVYNCPKCSTWNIRTYLINPLRVRM